MSKVLDSIFYQYWYPDSPDKKCCEFIDQTFGDGDGEISLPELEVAFRRMRPNGRPFWLRSAISGPCRRLAVF